MNEIARFTTPSLWFKPSSVEATDISKIFLVLSQDGNEILRKIETVYHEVEEDE